MLFSKVFSRHIDCLTDWKVILTSKNPNWRKPQNQKLKNDVLSNVVKFLNLTFRLKNRWVNSDPDDVTFESGVQPESVHSGTPFSEATSRTSISRSASNFGEIPIKTPDKTPNKTPIKTPNKFDLKARPIAQVAPISDLQNNDEGDGDSDYLPPGDNSESEDDEPKTKRTRSDEGTDVSKVARANFIKSLKSFRKKHPTKEEVSALELFHHANHGLRKADMVRIMKDAGFTDSELIRKVHAKVKTATCEYLKPRWSKLQFFHSFFSFSHQYFPTNQ